MTCSATARRRSSDQRRQKYGDPASNLNNNYSISNPIARIATTATRTWTDNGTGGPGTPGFGDNIPQCDLTNNAANGECAASGQQAFGTATPITAAIDPKLLNGWGIRPRDWQFGASVQQQLMPRVSIEVGYFKRWLQNFTATDNTAVTSADFTPFSITAPSDPRLPGGGGYTVGTMYNVVPGKFGQTANNITDAGNFGTQYSSYNGMLFNISARASKGLTFQGGINTGKTVTDNCAVLAVPPGQAARLAAAKDVGLIAGSTTGSQTTHSATTGSGLHHEGQRRRLLHRPEGRRPHRGDGQKRSGCTSPGELERANSDGRQSRAGPPDLGGRDDARHQPGGAGSGLGRSRQRDRPAVREDSEVRERTRSNVGVDLYNVHQLGRRF